MKQVEKAICTVCNKEVPVNEYYDHMEICSKVLLREGSEQIDANNAETFDYEFEQLHPEQTTDIDIFAEEEIIPIIEETPKPKSKPMCIFCQATFDDAEEFNRHACGDKK